MEKIKNILRAYPIILAILFIFLVSLMGFRNGIVKDNFKLGNAQVSDTGTASSKKKKSESKLDGNELYRENCSRCHQPPSKFSKEKFMTILKHMRTIANFTGDEQQALQDFLTK